MRHQKQRLPFVAHVGNLNIMYCFVHHMEKGVPVHGKKDMPKSLPCACGNGLITVIMLRGHSVSPVSVWEEK